MTTAKINLDFILRLVGLLFRASSLPFYLFNHTAVAETNDTNKKCLLNKENSKMVENLTPQFRVYATLC